MAPDRPQRAEFARPQEITRKHGTAGFACGKPALDEWLQRHALKSHHKGDARVLVVCDASLRVLAYVAVCAASVERKEAAAKIRRNAPNPIPMGLIARLAVTEEAQGRRIGPALLREAIFRIINAGEHIGIRGILVHAMDEDAANFYLRMGFSPSPIDEMTLMVSIEEIRQSLAPGPQQGRPVGNQSTTG